MLADIFSGKVRKWSDEAITALNPASKLPDREISVLHRKDGSGSTLIFTSYLSSADPDWHQRFGAATLIDWEVGVGVDGTQDLIALATSTENSITYAEAGQAARARPRCDPGFRINRETSCCLRQRTFKPASPAWSGFAAAFLCKHHQHARQRRLPDGGGHVCHQYRQIVVKSVFGLCWISSAWLLTRAAPMRPRSATSRCPQLARQVQQYWLTAFDCGISRRASAAASRVPQDHPFGRQIDSKRGSPRE